MLAKQGPTHDKLQPLQLQCLVLQIDDDGDDSIDNIDNTADDVDIYDNDAVLLQPQIISNTWSTLQLMTCSTNDNAITTL